jgi:RNA polymerase sigma factor (sigma-70 family)
VSRPRLDAVLRHAGSLVAHPEAAPDAELLRRFADGRDDAAFAALVARHGPMVWAVCRNLLPHDPDAEDAFQATFLALVRGAGKVRAGDRLAGWLHGVAVRVALKARRAAAHRRKREQAAAGAEADKPVPDGAWDELLAAVHEEVQVLPEALRSAFVLCGLEGVRQHDAAARLGCTPGTLTTRLTRARQRLLAGLARRGIAPPVATGAVGVAATTGAAAPVALTARAVDLVRAVRPISPSVLYLAQGVIDMNARSKWLAAAILAAIGLSATVGTAVISNAPAQPQPGGTGGGGRPAADPAPRGGSGGFGGGGAMPTRGWEYKVVFGALGTGNAEADLNKLGADGWELCATGERGAVVFKRPKGSPMIGGGIGGGVGGIPMAGGIASLDAAADALMRRADRNADGKISRDEASDAGRVGGEFDTIDANKDGSIDAAEYRKYLESRSRGRGPAGGPGGENPFGGAGGGFSPGGGGRGGPGGRGPGPEPEMQVHRLRNAEAAEMAGLLKEVFGRQPGVTVTADPRTNSLIVNADPDTQKAVQALLQRLDEPSAPPPRKK